MPVLKGKSLVAEIIESLRFPVTYEKLRKTMRKPSFGEYNLGALAGTVIGSIGGLFAIGAVRAVLSGDITKLFKTPMLGMISWVVCGVVGWLLGGQIGPRLGQKYYSQQAEMIGGALGGMVPVGLVILWALYMSLH